MVSSTRKYRPGEIPGVEEIAAKVRQSGDYPPRASRPGGRTTAIPQRRATTNIPNVPIRAGGQPDPDYTVIEPPRVATIPIRLPVLASYKQRMHAWQQSPWIAIGVKICGALLVWEILVQGFVGYTNALGDPLQYSQMAHRDTAVISLRNQKQQIRAFVQNRHLNVLILPQDDPEKARIIEGPDLSLAGVKDPEHTMIDVIVQGSIITVKLQGPLEVRGLLPDRQQLQWTADLNQLEGQKKGGK